MSWNYTWSLTQAERREKNWMLLLDMETMNPKRGWMFVRNLHVALVDTEEDAHRAKEEKVTNPEVVDRIMEKIPLSHRRVCVFRDGDKACFDYGARRIVAHVVCARRAERFFPFKVPFDDPWVRPTCPAVTVNARCFRIVPKSKDCMRSSYDQQKGPDFWRAFCTVDEAVAWVNALCAQFPTLEELKRKSQPRQIPKTKGLWYVRERNAPRPGYFRNEIAVLQFGKTSNQFAHDETGDFYSITTYQDIHTPHAKGNKRAKLN